MHKKLFYIFIGLLFGLGFTAYAANVSLTKNGVIEYLNYIGDSFCIGCTATTTNSRLEVNGQSTALNFNSTSTTDANNLPQIAFTNATGTSVYASGSSTFQILNAETITIPSITSTGLAVNSVGRVYGAATSTFTSPLVYSNGVVNCPTCTIGGITGEVNWLYNYQGLTRTPTTTTDVLIGASATTSRAKLEVVDGGSGIAGAFLSGKVGVGTGTPLSTLSVQGISGPATDNVFSVATSTGAQLLNLANTGIFSLGSNFSVNSGSVTAGTFTERSGGTVMSFTNGQSATSLFSFTSGVTSSLSDVMTIGSNTGSNRTTVGATNVVNIDSTFSPNSGIASFNSLTTTPTINQTGSASGISRNFYVNPTITRAADFRAFETVAYTFNLSRSGTVATTTSFELAAYTLASTSAITVTSASMVNITGGPIAGSNVTISSSTALTIRGGAVAGSGTVTDAYGIFASAPTGATNNYAAVFTGGNVGIGTTSPWARLSVAGGGADLGHFALAGYFSATNTSATSTFSGGFSSDGTNGLYAFTNGNVSVGTTSIPNAKFVVAQAADLGGIEVRGFDDVSDDYVRMSLDSQGFSNINSSIGFRLQQAATSIAFVSTTATEGFRMFDDIPLTFGTTLATRYLLGRDNTSGNLRLAYGGAISTAGNVRLTVDSTGNLGVGTTSPWRTVSMNGTGAWSNLTAAGATKNSLCIDATTKEVMENAASSCLVSSGRYKHDIEDYANALSTVALLRPRLFKSNDTNEQHYGFIAEEVAQVDNRFVDYDEQGQAHSVRYQEMVSILTKAIQEQQQQIEALEVRLEQLENK